MDWTLLNIFFLLFLWTARFGWGVYREIKGKEIGGLFPIAEPYKPLLGHFDGKLLGNRLTNFIFTGRYKGFGFKVFIGRDGKNDHQLLQIKKNPVSIRITLELPRESKFRLWVYGKSPGMVFFMKRVQSVIPDSLTRFYAYSEDPEQSKIYLNDSSHLSALRELINQGWTGTRLTKILLGRKDIQVVRLYDPSHSLPEFISATLDQLIVLAKGL
jgi:hypothetical protein